jgi:hypothetical protein
MHDRSQSHISNNDLLRVTATFLAEERANTAELLAYIGEFDARQLYGPAGYSSMHLYCIEELHMDEDEALERILVARTARRFPAIFPAIAEGRLQLYSVVMLAPHLTDETADALLAAASFKLEREIEQLLAERFPRSGTSTPEQDHTALEP